MNSDCPEIGNIDGVPISFDTPASHSADFICVKSVLIVTTGNAKKIKNSFSVI